MRLRSVLTVLLLTAVAPCATALPEAIVVLIGDQHSAYDKVPQFVARIDRLRRENPGIPLAVLIDGDAFEYGNALGRRTHGAIDFAMFAALMKRAPTVLNLGNHEPDLFAMPEVVRRLRETGVTVISANARNRMTGELFAPAMTRLKLGAHELAIVGLTTDALATFRVAIRPDLDLADPVVWARQSLAGLLKGAELPVVLSHAGLRADRQILPLLPDGTLFSGAHDHLRLVHHERGIVYFHSGSWMDCVSVARLEKAPAGLRWTLEQEAVTATDPADPELAALVRETFATQLTPEETRIVGHTTAAMTPAEAATFAVAAARKAAQADVALIGGTTFGGGLPAGPVSRYAFDGCVRFDGTLFVGEITGARLKEILAHANQGSDTPFADRAGENLVAVCAVDIDPARTYRLVTTDWVARNATKYLGENPPALKEQQPTLLLKAVVLAALAGGSH